MCLTCVCVCVRACVRARVCVCLSISRCLSVCVPHRVGAVQRLLLAVVGGDAVPAGGPAPQRGGGAAAGDGLQAGRPQHGLRGRVRTRGARLHREPGQRHSSSLLWHRSGGTSSLPVLVMLMLMMLIILIRMILIMLTMILYVSSYSV